MLPVLIVVGWIFKGKRKEKKAIDIREWFTYNGREILAGRDAKKVEKKKEKENQKPKNKKYINKQQTQSPRL